jgi:nucleoside-diphosphate-sugar epimerase
MSAMAFHRVLVTGASGFIGGWVAKTLVDRRVPVRALYRRAARPPELARLQERGAELLRGDLTAPDAACRALEGVDAVVHAAGPSQYWGPEELFRADVYEATSRLLEQSRASGCQAFVYISSLAVHGFGRHRGSSEEGPYFPLITDYQRYKLRAEQAVSAAGTPGFRTVVLRPGDVYGPGDITTFYRMLHYQRRGVKGVVGDGRYLTSLVYVEDLAEAVVLALRSGDAAGEIINITGGEEVTWREVLEYTAWLLGARPWLTLPVPLARLVVKAILAPFFTLVPLPVGQYLTRYAIDHVAYDFHFRIDKARRLLGFEPRVGWREGLRRTVEAFQEYEPADGSRQRRREGRRQGRGEAWRDSRHG